MSRHRITVTREIEMPHGFIVSNELRITFDFFPAHGPLWNRALGQYDEPPAPASCEFVDAEQEHWIDGKRRWIPARQPLADWAEAWLDEHQDQAAEQVEEDQNAD